VNKVTSASLGYPLSVFNKISTLKIKIMGARSLRLSVCVCVYVKTVWSAKEKKQAKNSDDEGTAKEKGNRKEDREQQRREGTAQEKGRRDRIADRASREGWARGRETKRRERDRERKKDKFQGKERVHEEGDE